MRPPPPPTPDAAALDAVPAELAHGARVVPLTLRGGVLEVGVGPAHGGDGDGATAALERLRIRAGAVAVTTVPITDPEAAALRAYARRTLAAAEVVGGAAPPEATAVVTAVLDAAVGTGASDVHLEAVPDGLRVRLRRDGAVHPAATLPVGLRDPVVARIKVLAGLDVAERRAPQDGRLTHPVPSGAVDVRVATIPVRHGERVTLRLLPRDGVTDLEGLGLPDVVRTALAEAGTSGSGLVVLCGPTGSGKTTTLHAVAARVADGDRTVLALEDPVEREVPGVSQTQIDPAAGVTFATGLRHLLRHDPDVLVVGEVRDAVTADLAVEAAGTGHLVLTTLHAADAAGAVDRLDELGVGVARAAAVLRLVVAQRLLALPCPTCSGAGCHDCDGTGTRGRTAVAEGITWDAALRAAVLAAPDPAARRAVLRAARRPGLRAAALAAAAAGRADATAARRATPEPDG